MTRISRRLAACAAGFALLAPVLAAHAQSPAWPARSVRLVIPFGAGGTADVTARTIAQQLSERWGQQVIVDNKPGGDTVIAAAEVQRAAPDGYTLLMAINSTLTLTPHTLKVPYDPMTDFTFIGQATDVPMLVLVPDAFPARSVSELVDQARAKPGALNSGGPATVTQLVQEQFAREAKVKFTWVPYKSGPDVTKALLGGEIQVGVDAVVNNLPHLQSGKLRALAVTTPVRLKTLPQVPTLQEQGIRDQRISLSHIVLAPKGLPKVVQDRIQADLQFVMNKPDVVDKLAALGVQAAWRDGAELARSVQVESAATGALVRELGLRPQ
ncbi:Bug family tripartite tricarboxylate transporter substrate binding protein [Ramlibacter sp. MAHUQ-53]|uniref:Bug family tripartite tricarboxylate transporter substrate binding protein n=1 Tax=unclassified Ramlibacter TaxID=2617605 RepID=UPI003634FB0D